MQTNIVTRHKIFDIIKGIGIILMVMAHAGFGLKFISLFHMPLFFIVSGVFFKEKSYESITAIKFYIIKKAKSLLLPFIILTLLLLYLHNFFIDINILTDNSLFITQHSNGNQFGLSFYYTNMQILMKSLYTILLVHEEQLFAASWFLRVLFYISVMFCIGSYILSKSLLKVNCYKYFDILRFLICVICLILGFICHKMNFNFYSIGTMLSSSICFELGILYGKYKNKIAINIYSCFISILFLLFYLWKYNTKISIVFNSYENPLWLIICSISGFIFIKYLSKIIDKHYKCLSILLSFIGQNTMPILCLHLIFFKLVTFMQVCIYNEPKYMLASFLYLYNNRLWWLVYTLFGIIGPLFVKYLYEKIKLLR